MSHAGTVASDPASFWAVGLDFAAKTDRVLRSNELDDAMRRGLFVWIDADVSDPAAVDLLKRSGLLSDALIEECLAPEPVIREVRYESCLHLTFCECRRHDGALELLRIDVIAGDGYLVTLRRCPVDSLREVRREYRADFVRHAKTPSFLLYEIADHLLEHYTSVQDGLDAEVRAMQGELMRHVDDEVFARVSGLGAVLLRFRGVLVPTRVMLGELGTRRNDFVSESTQPFLIAMVGTIDHLLQDVTVNREVLSESLNLHMSMLAHRTNHVLTRLTVLSVIFLPLTFLCGVWGMNFEYMPEIGWELGYPMFWCVVALVVAGQIWFLKRKKWL